MRLVAHRLSHAVNSVHARSGEHVDCFSPLFHRRDTLLTCKYIDTDKDKARRVTRGIRSVMGKAYTYIMSSLIFISHTSIGSV